ncbi:MAG: hypothetical protein IPM45_01420 [Acidimicrobiales bacterium]|nr:hypothetical protein [Acidimicrobiales bacterium]
MLRRPVLALSPVLVGLVLLVACGSDDGDDGSSTAGGSEVSTSTTIDPVAAARAYAEPGPYPVGVITLPLADGREVEVWYPAVAGSEAGRTPASWDLRDGLPDTLSALVTDDLAPVYETAAYPDLPPATEGPYPLVLFSHGFGGVRTQSTELTTHLASWGMVVASPDHPSRGPAVLLSGAPSQGTGEDDLLDAIELVSSQATTPGSPLDGLVDTELLAVVGHSAGGGSAFLLAEDPRVLGYVALASPVGVPRPPAPGESTTSSVTAPPPPDKPSLLIAGDDDDIADLDRVEQAYERLPAPKELIVIGGAGHQAFSDICLIRPDLGRLPGIATQIGLTFPERTVQLIDDGCADPTPVESTFPIIDHTTTAWLRALYGIDPEPVGLGPELAEAYAPVPVTVTAEG